MGIKPRYTDLSCPPDEILKLQAYPVENPFQDTARRFETIGNDLLKVSSETETEFLLIGRRLQDFYENTSKISELSSSAAELLSGDKIKETMGGLNALFGRMAEYVKESEANTARRIEKLKDVLTSAEGVAGQFEEYLNMSKNLRQIGTTAMVYCAPMAESTGFMALAKNIRGLSDNVHSRSLMGANDIKAILFRVNEAMHKVVNVKDGQYEQMHEILAQVQDSIANLQGRHESASEAFAAIAEWSQAVSGNIGNVVFSSQFQDITRQKFERIKLSMDTFGEKLLSRDDMGWGPGRSGLEAEIGLFCERQVREIVKVKDTLVNAVAEIFSSLEEIAASMKEMSVHTHEMVDSGDATGLSFLEDMGGSLESVKATLSEIFEADMGISKSIASAGDAVEKIVGMVGEIEAIEDEIDIIAMNAALKSAQAGRTGSAMGVIAEKIRKLSSESIDMTSKTAGDLRAMRKDVEALLSEVTGVLEVTMSEASRMENEMGSLIETLQRLNAHTSAVLGDMDEEVCSLSEEIASTVKETSARDNADRILKHVISGLSDIARKSGTHISEDAALPGPGGQSRTVLLTSLHEGEGDADIDSAPNGDGFFGNNVEFFD